jgi:hypothetical protein
MDRQPSGVREGREDVTHREIADSEILRYHRAIERAKLGGKPNIAVCQTKLDNWLEYRHSHQQDGTLDDKARL